MIYMYIYIIFIYIHIHIDNQTGKVQATAATLRLKDWSATSVLLFKEPISAKLEAL